MKNLLIIAPAYRPLVGGVESHIYEVNNILKKHYNITVLVRYSESMPENQIIKGVKVIRLPRKINTWNMLPWLLIHGSILIKTNIVHSHDFYPQVLHRLLGHKQWVHTFHGYEGYPIAQEAIVGRNKIRNEIPYCIAVGSFIEKWYGTKCDSIIYGGIDTTRFSQQTKHKQKYDFIYYGRLDVDTGFVDYLKSFRELSNLYPHITMVVLGGGSKESWAEQYISKHSLKVEMLGWQPVIDSFLEASGVAFVSGYLGILEAGLAKKPIIAYYETPIKKDYLEMHPMADNMEIVDSVEGIYKSAQQLIMQKSDKVDKMYEWAQQQTWERIAELYISYYEKRRP